MRFPKWRGVPGPDGHRGIFVNLLQLGLALAIGGYLLGIPYAIGFRLYKGRWPQY